MDYVSGGVHHVGILQASLVRGEILHCGIYLFMSDQDRHFLDRHAAVQEVRDSGTAETVRVHVFQIRCGGNFIQHGADPACTEAFAVPVDEQRRVSVMPAAEILTKSQNGNIIQEDGALLIAFPQNNALSGIELNILLIQSNNFPNTAAGGQQEADDRVVPDGAGIPLQKLDI